MCQISRQSDIAFAFYSSFCKCAKRGRKIRRKKTMKKLSQLLKSHISGTLEAILLKFGMWSADSGGSVHSKNRLDSSRQHRATEMRKLHFLSSCQYTYGCCAPASWAAQHTTMCLDISISNSLSFFWKSSIIADLFASALWYHTVMGKLCNISVISHIVYSTDSTCTVDYHTVQ